MRFWLKANRPGMQLLCRVVLPRAGSARSESAPHRPGARRQVRVLRTLADAQSAPAGAASGAQEPLLCAELNRAVVTEGAYVDQVLLNVQAGPGDYEIYIDDLEVGPVFEDHRTNPDTAPTGPGPSSTPIPQTVQHRAAEVKINDVQLLVNGERFFLRGIRHTGTPLKTLRDAGFNTVWLDETTPPGLVEDAVNLGFWIVPTPDAAAPAG